MQYVIMYTVNKPYVNYLNLDHERELKALLAKRTSVDDKLDQLSDLMREGSEVYSALEGAYERDIEVCL